MAGGQRDSWGGSSLWYHAPAQRESKGWEAIAVQGNRQLLRISMSERPPFVSLPLVPAQFPSPVTSSSRASVMVGNNQSGFVGEGSPTAGALVMAMPLACKCALEPLVGHPGPFLHNHKQLVLLGYLSIMHPLKMNDNGAHNVGM